MIGVVATLKVQPDKASEFEAVFLDMAAKVKGNEPGCLLYQLTKSKTEAGIYKVLELYASMDDLASSFQTCKLFVDLWMILCKACTNIDRKITKGHFHFFQY